MDHKGLEYFETQPSLSSWQTRWWEYISHFDFTIQHVDGVTNQVVDCLSRYYEANGPDDHHQEHEFVSADSQLNPDGELLPIQWYVELRTTAARRSRRLAEHVEQRVLNSDAMNDDAVTTLDEVPAPDDEPIAFTSGANGQSLRAHVERDINLARLV